MRAIGDSKTSLLRIVERAGLAGVLAMTCGAASARPFDAKALARYDRSYVQCEASFPDMKGHRDEAYLHLWRIAPDDKGLARLAKLRTDPAYAAEQKRFATPAAAASAPSPDVLQRQCRGLWSEHQRALSEAPPKKR